MIRGASIIFIGQDRKKIILAEADVEEDQHDKLMHRKESEAN